MPAGEIPAGGIAWLSVSIYAAKTAEGVNLSHIELFYGFLYQPDPKVESQYRNSIIARFA